MSEATRGEFRIGFRSRILAGYRPAWEIMISYRGFGFSDILDQVLFPNGQQTAVVMERGRVRILEDYGVDIAVRKVTDCRNFPLT